MHGDEHEAAEIMNRGFYVTTPIYYISGNPHIGHAYTTIAADVLTRFYRTRGESFLLTGTDEHGQKVAAAAAEAGMTPQAWTDALVPKWQALAERYDIRYDDFIRTTQTRHIDTCIKAFEMLKASGDIYLGKYEGWYCTNDETFWLEAKLIDGRCPNPECRREVQWLSEKNWFFALSRYREKLLEHFRTYPRWVQPERAYNEMLAVLETGLEDLCISRVNLDWGVPLPGGGVMYVWLDALLNYISALGWAVDDTKFTRFWPAEVQIIGKEIARFHAIIWPALLWALELPVPRRIFAHGWITIEGEKMSKSLGNVLDPFLLADRFGADTMRFFFLREAPFGSDFSFSEEKVRLRHNTDLGNDLGNLVKRSLAMLSRYRQGNVPDAAPSVFWARFAHTDGSDQADWLTRVETSIAELRFRDALETIWELVSALNRFIDERKPWELHKANKETELDSVLYDLCEGLRRLACVLFPFMPEKATDIWQQLGFEGAPDRHWEQQLRGDHAIAPHTRTRPSEAPLFPRLELIAP
jgi:methionyl-tRNA synthetase